MSSNGSLPEFYYQIERHVAIQQSEIFLLHGDVNGYPRLPGQNLVSFLRAVSAASARKRCEDTAPSPADLAKTQLFATLSPAGGLQMEEAHRAEFDKHIPPKQQTAFPAPGGGGILAQFAELNDYFRPKKSNLQQPPLTLVLQDADLLFNEEMPMIEPERTIISYLRQWASRPLLTFNGDSHRVYLISASEVGIRSALMQGRIASVGIPLPDEQARLDFIVRLSQQAIEENRKIQMEDGLTEEELARITGALNLLQIEDVVYQAELQDNRLTRELVQNRKDELVRTTYKEVITIEYPEHGFEKLVFRKEMTRYFTDYMAPLLASGDKGTPKGCIFSGNPGSGKTRFASALAGSLKMPLVVVQTEKIKNKYVGESNKNMRRLCEGIVALSPAIILIDEIDKVLPTGDDNTGVSQEILAQLQTFMSDLDRGVSFFIGTTNYPERIPRALLRPGRFEEVIPLLPQHLDGLRGKVLEVLSADSGKEFEAGVDWEAVGEAAVDYTGADLGVLIIKAHKIAVLDGRKTISQGDLETAVANIVPTLNETEEMVESAIRFCSDKSHIPPSLLAKMNEPTDNVEVSQSRRRKIRKVEA